MKNEIEGGSELSPSEVQLLEQLRQQPEMMERLGSILALTRNAEGPLKTADEVEELLIRELRLLGNTSLCQWATQAEARVSDELKGQDPTIRSRKKNANVVVCLWGGVGARTDLAQPDPELRPPFAGAVRGEFAGTVAATTTGADGLWHRALLCPGGGECPGTLWFQAGQQRGAYGHVG